MDRKKSIKDGVNQVAQLLILYPVLEGLKTRLRPEDALLKTTAVMSLALPLLLRSVSNAVFFVSRS